MRDHSHHIQLTREEAVSQMIAALDALPGGFGMGAGAPTRPGTIERVSLADGVGRVLAADVAAGCDMPTALTCCMDSVAVHWAAFEGLPDGQLPDTSGWVRGRDWELANTGVAMPEGFDTAVVVEHVAFSDDEQFITLYAAPSRQGAGTRAAGSFFHAGDVLACAGTRLTADLAARIGSGNVGAVPVVRRPRVAFIPTGNELLPPGAPFDPRRPLDFAGRGRNFETNSILVRARVREWGGEFLPFDIVPDRFEDIRETVSCAVREADIVVLNAGSSKGSDDWCVEVLEEMGHVICHQTNHGPGHHSSYALVDDVPIVGISGPSSGASFTLGFYLRPVMRRFLGLAPEVPKVPARLVGELPVGGHGAKAHGAQAGAGATAGQQRPVGEKRPKEHPQVPYGTPEFFSIVLLHVEHTPDGTLTARPVPGRPGSPESFEANAFCMVGNGPGVKSPQVGDVVQAEWR